MFESISIDFTTNLLEISTTFISGTNKYNCVYAIIDRLKNIVRLVLYFTKDKFLHSINTAKYFLKTLKGFVKYLNDHTQF